MKTAIYSLYQKKEIDRAKFFVNKIKKNLTENRQLFILINDEKDEDFSEFCLSHSRFIHILCKGYNLGVASGRNYLLKEAKKQGYNFFISCDNDIIYEEHYFEKIEFHYFDLKKKYKNVGLVQPVLLDGEQYKDLFSLTENDRWNSIDDKIFEFSFESLKKKYIEKYTEEKYLNTYYHVGISNIWKAHFGNLDSNLFKIPNEFKTSHATFRSDLNNLNDISKVSNVVSIASTAGGISAFDIDFLDRNGYYNEIFDPFLYEDSEFGFRSFVNASNNFLLLDCCAIHDIFMKVTNRKILQKTNLAKLRSVEQRDVNLHDNQKKILVQKSIFDVWNHIEGVFKYFKVKMSSTSIDAYIIKYYIELLFGICISNFKIPNDKSTFNIFSYIFNTLDIEIDKFNIVIPITNNENLIIGQHQIIQNENIFAASLMNVRLENSKSNSKYFDLYINIKYLNKQKYKINIDIQSHDVTYNVKCDFDIQDLLSNNENTPLISNLIVKNKTYDFGSFSKEDLYPEPLLDLYSNSMRDFFTPIEKLKIKSGSFMAKALTFFLKEKIIARKIDKFGKKSILIFTDSRGQHIPSGYTHKIFGEKIKEAYPNVQVDLVLCPMKWTTTLDFFEYTKKHDISMYDYVVLYTGVVEWSPRPQKSAINDLYNNQKLANLDSWNNTRDYRKKIVNNKKDLFDSFFGENNIKNYLNTPFDTEYEGEKTINMYSLDMLTNIVIPKLKTYKNLIFINTNHIVKGWEGDFKRGRPKNISIIHKYAEEISKSFPKKQLVDLSSWLEEEIKKYTCDNMHLTEEGNKWIMNKICTKIEFLDNNGKYFSEMITKDLKKLIDFKNIEKFNKLKREVFVKKYTEEKYLATLIIGIKLKDSDPSRLINLKFLLEWLQFYFEKMFDILIVEQGNNEKIDKSIFSQYTNVRYEFLYNPEYYNRGWGYNVAVKHYCNNAKVVVLMDTDVLPGSNFVADIRDCYINRYKVISPYQNIYYTTPKDAEYILENKSFDSLLDVTQIKNPVTITGGVVIVDKQTYLSVKGFEQYRGYGCEDRSFDVALLAMCKKEDIKISNSIFVHLYHPSNQENRENFDEIYSHLVKNYHCEWTKELTKTDYIHRYCKHVTDTEITKLIIKKNISFGDINLYKSRKDLSINGLKIKPDNKVENILLPPNFTNLKDYSKKELYEAPDADVDQLEQFRNAFLGERCFIIGNGPSLNKHDLSLLENEYSFGVNSFYYKTKETGFRPTFYVVEDTSVMKENLPEIKNFYAPFKFFPTIYKRLHPKDPNTFFFTMNRGFYEKSSPNYCVPRFSTDATKELFCGQSVTYINLQLAYFMGFTEVYLIGMDFSYIIPDSHKRTGDVLLSDSDDENHFHKDYFGKGKTWKDPKLDRVGNNYRMAKLAFESTGRKIYNATVGGSLEIFDRTDYYELFNKKSENKVAKIKGSFSDANKLFSQKRYSDALVLYLQLAEEDSKFTVYKQAVMNAYLKAKEFNQPIQSEIVNRVKKFI